MSSIGWRIFHSLGSETRIKILELLSSKEMHISEIARELDISVPVISKHVKVLEESELLERHVFGKSHVLKPNRKNIHLAVDSFAPTRHVEVEKGASLMEALRNVADIDVRKKGDREMIVSTDGEEGLFVYEIDGQFGDKNVNDCVLEDDTIVDWKKLEPITRIRLDIHVRE
jgi:DNA-binding transcriptional ArsR family regulator